MSCRLFLFDLDGTVADTAPDLVRAANLVRTVRGLDPLPDSILRPMASRGAPGLIGTCFGIQKTDPSFPALRDEFLRNYEAGMTVDSRPFPGILEMLAELRAAGIRTGIVTNKYTHLARKLAAGLDLSSRFDIILGSDADRCAMKPAPDSLLTAAEALGIAPADALYAGDDPRDVQAAHASGMPCAAVRWGYLASDPETWDADIVVSEPRELAVWALSR